jgi:hypothetical protein
MAYKMQGGVKNYLGNQKMVNAPLHWRSGPQHPSTELAYITQAEKDLLVNKDLHASLKGGVNRGPSGIMSLNGWGDTGEGFADKSFAGNERRGREVSVTRGSPRGPQTVTRRTKTVNTMPDVVDQKYSGDGWFSGYRNLDARGQPKMGLSYLGDRLKNVIPTMLSAAAGFPPIASAVNLGRKLLNRPVEEEDEEITSDYQLTPDGYRYVGGSMEDTMKDFRRKYPLDLSKTLSSSNTNVGVDYPTNYLPPNLGGVDHFPRSTQPNDIFTDSGVPWWGKAAKDGGRIGYAFAGPVGVEQQTDFIEGPQGGEEFQETVVEGQQQPSTEQLEALAMHIFQLPLDQLDDQQLVVVYQAAMQGEPMEEAVQEEDVQFAANGGLAGLL